MHQCEFCEFGTKAFNVGFSSYGELSRHVHECHPYAFQNLHAWMIQCSMCLAPPCNRKNLEMHMFAMHDMDNPTFEESFANTAQFCAWLAAYQSVSGDVYTQVSRYDLDGVKHMEFVCDWKQNGDDVSSPKCLASIKLRWEQIVEVHYFTFDILLILDLNRLQYNHVIRGTRRRSHLEVSWNCSMRRERKCIYKHCGRLNYPRKSRRRIPAIPLTLHKKSDVLGRILRCRI